MKLTARIYQVVLTILFLGVISICFLNDVFSFYDVPKVMKNENRKPTPKPVFDVSFMDPYPKRYDRYFNDHFPYREELGFMNTLICFFFFHQSPLPGVVELGSHGWLFYDQRESEVFQGKFRFADWQVASIAKELRERTLRYRAKGIRFYVAFPPMKAEVYPEYLPRDYRRTPSGTVTDRVVHAIRQDSVIQYIDLKEPLLKSKSKGRLYSVNDNHWNRLGAFYAYDAIIRRIRQDFPSVKLLTESDVGFTPDTIPAGNLAIMIGMSEFLHEVDYKPTFRNQKGVFSVGTHPKPDWAIPVDNYEYVMNTGDATLPDAVFIRDSYTDLLMPFLGESFNRSTYIFDGWRYLSNDAIIDDVKAPIVVLILFEPHISHLAGVR